MKNLEITLDKITATFDNDEVIEVKIQKKQAQSLADIIGYLSDSINFQREVIAKMIGRLQEIDVQFKLEDYLPEEVNENQNEENV